MGAGVLLALPMMLLVAALLVYPLGRLVTVALGPPHGFGNLAAFFDHPANTRVIRITFLDSALVTVLCLAVGAVVAWSLRVTERRANRLLLWTAMIVPFLMGSVLKLYAFTILLESHGVVNGALRLLGMADEPVELLYNRFAVVLGLTYQMLPFAVLPLLAGFRTIDPELARAAEGLGAGRLRAVWDTVVPLAVPSLLATGTLVYIITLGFFLTPEVLGGPSSPFTASLIYQDVFEFYDVTSAAVSALVLLVGSLAVVGVGYWVVGRERLARAVAA